jgi:hypothetical protein
LLFLTQEGDGDDARRSLSEAKHKEKQRQQRIVGLQNEIQMLEGIVDRPPPECNTEEIQRQLVRFLSLLIF